jgi:hypothetical protein
VLASAVRIGADGRGSLTAPGALQSWPGIVHGGAAVANADAAARSHGLAGPRIAETRLTSSLPTETALHLDVRADDGAVSLAMLRGGQTLASGSVRALAASGPGAAAWAGGRGGDALPMSDDCLACGARNALGLQASLRFDADGVWARVSPSPAWRLPDGRVHPGLAPVVLDEIAWWLGALVAKEGGLTNRLAVTFLAPDLASGETVVAAGRFDAVRPIDRRGAFWRTETALATASGAPLASASIVFRGGAEYSARQLAYFRARARPEVFRRMFPNHAG